jgi:WD40 repeat protein
MLPFAFVPDGHALMLRSDSGVQAIDFATGQQELFLPAPQPISAAALSPDGQTLAWGLPDGVIQIIRISNPEELAEAIGHFDPVYDLQFDPSSEYLFSASHDGYVREWAFDGRHVASFNVGGEALGFGLSTDGEWIAIILADGPVQLWRVYDAAHIRDLGGTGGFDTSDAHFSPDGQYLTADLATGLYLWRLSDDQLIWNVVKNSMAVAYSPDGQYLAYSDIDDGNKVVLASPDGSQVIRVIDQMPGPVWEMFFSPDGSRLAATDGTEIRIWRVSDGSLIAFGLPACP